VRVLLANVVQLSWAEWGYDIVPVTLTEEHMRIQQVQWDTEQAELEEAEHEEVAWLVHEQAEHEEAARAQLARDEALMAAEEAMALARKTEAAELEDGELGAVMHPGAI